MSRIGGGLEQQFAESREHLRGVAYRLLGSTSEAEDALQETWLKINRSETEDIKCARAWLTTVVARVCLDMLRTRRSRREEPLEAMPERLSGDDPAAERALADAIGPALLIVLDRLTPAERVAFVLHDLFDLSFEELAPIINRTPAAARQLASRARRRVRGTGTPSVDVGRRRDLVDAFLAASRDGDFERLLAVLSPDVVLRADDLAVRTAAANQRRGAPNISPEIHGAARVAEAFKGRARGASPALIDGEPGAVWVVAGHVRAAFIFRSTDGKISEIELVMEPEGIAAHDVRVSPTFE